MARNTLYYELQDALELSGCAICRLGDKAVNRYLEALVYEHAHDYRVRAEVMLARGFCNLHAWQLRECRGAALDAAMLGADVLGEWLRLLESFTPQTDSMATLSRLRTALGGPAVPAAHDLAEALAPQRPCPACKTRDTTERAYIHELLAHLDDADLTLAYVEAGGLCLRHFRQTLDEVTTPEQAERLTALQREALTLLLDEVREFIRKHDYRFMDEMTAAEGGSWLKALELLSGRRGTR